MKVKDKLKKLIYFSCFISLFYGCGPNAEERAKMIQHIKDSIQISIQHRFDSIATARIQAQKDSIEIIKKYSKERTPEEYLSILCKGHWGFDVNDNNNGIVFGDTGAFMRRESLSEGSQCVYKGSWSFGKFDGTYFSKCLLVVTKGMNYTDYQKFDTANWYLIITPTNTTLRAPSGKELNNYSN